MQSIERQYRQQFGTHVALESLANEGAAVAAREFFIYTRALISAFLYLHLAQLKPSSPLAAL